MVSALSLSMASVNTSWALPVSSISCPPSTFLPMSSAHGRSASAARASPCSVVLPIYTSATSSVRNRGLL